MKKSFMHHHVPRMAHKVLLFTQCVKSTHKSHPGLVGSDNMIVWHCEPPLTHRKFHFHDPKRDTTILGNIRQVSRKTSRAALRPTCLYRVHNFKGFICLNKIKTMSRYFTQAITQNAFLFLNSFQTYLSKLFHFCHSPVTRSFSLFDKSWSFSITCSFRIKTMPFLLTIFAIMILQRIHEKKYFIKIIEKLSSLKFTQHLILLWYFTTHFP